MSQLVRVVLEEMDSRNTTELLNLHNLGHQQLLNALIQHGYYDPAKDEQPGCVELIRILLGRFLNVSPWSDEHITLTSGKSQKQISSVLSGTKGIGSRTCVTDTIVRCPNSEPGTIPAQYGLEISPSFCPPLWGGRRVGNNPVVTEMA